MRPKTTRIVGAENLIINSYVEDSSCTIRLRTTPTEIVLININNYSKIQVENMSEAVSPGKVEPEGLVITSAEEVKRFLKEGEALLKK